MRDQAVAQAAARSDNPVDVFEDRFGSAEAVLVTECPAAVRAVPEALGKKAGPEDDRTEGKALP